VGPVLLSALAAGVLSAAPIGIAIDLQPGKVFLASFRAPASGPGGRFRGAVALYGSASEIKIEGRAEPVADRWEIRAAIPYAEIPPDWANRFRPDGFGYRLAGEVDGRPVSWAGREPWDAVSVAGGLETVGRFVKLSSFELTALSPQRSEARARLRVANPLSFPVGVAGSDYVVRSSGRPIGRGTTRERTLRPRRESTLEVPVAVDRRELLAAAGDAFAPGRDVEAQLHGTLSLRFGAEEIRIPLDLPTRMGTSAVVPPLEGTGLVPNR
jgi:LEA14-like dessication related protein